MNLAAAMLLAGTGAVLVVSGVRDPVGGPLGMLVSLLRGTTPDYTAHTSVLAPVSTQVARDPAAYTPVGAEAAAAADPGWMATLAAGQQAPTVTGRPTRYQAPQ